LDPVAAVFADLFVDATPFLGAGHQAQR
jgi:hypothetical protein